MTLNEEEVVVSNRTVPKERVRFDKDVVTDQQTVQEDVRKERIDACDGSIPRSPFRSPANAPRGVRRSVMIAFWDDEEAAAAFAKDHPLGQRYADHGFRAVLRPLRAFGTWPGLPDDLPRARDAVHDGPVLVTTLGRLRMTP